MHPHELAWSEVDPARIAFDSEKLRDGVRAFLTGRLASHVPRIYPTLSVDAAWYDLMDDLDKFMEREYGRWTLDWVSFDLTGDDTSDPEVWTDQIVDALHRKRDYLQRFAQMLEEIRGRAEAARGDVSKLEAAGSDAAKQFVNFVFEWTSDSEGWFFQIDEAVDWLVEVLGHNPGNAGGHAAYSLNSEFSYELETTPEALDKVSGQIGKQIVQWFK